MPRRDAPPGAPTAAGWGDRAPSPSSPCRWSTWCQADAGGSRKVRFWCGSAASYSIGMSIVRPGLRLGHRPIELHRRSGDPPVASCASARSEDHRRVSSRSRPSVLDREAGDRIAPGLGALLPSAVSRLPTTRWVRARPDCAVALVGRRDATASIRPRAAVRAPAPPRLSPDCTASTAWSPEGLQPRRFRTGGLVERRGLRPKPRGPATESRRTARSDAWVTSQGEHSPGPRRRGKDFSRRRPGVPVLGASPRRGNGRGSSAPLPRAPRAPPRSGRASSTG